MEPQSSVCIRDVISHILRAALQFLRYKLGTAPTELEFSLAVMAFSSFIPQSMQSSQKTRPPPRPMGPHQCFSHLQ